MSRTLVCWVAGGCLLAGCAGTYESAVRRDFSGQQRERAQRPTRATDAAATVPVDGDASALAGTAGAPSPAAPAGEAVGYVAMALAESPELQAEFSRWRAAWKRLPRPGGCLS